VSIAATRVGSESVHYAQSSGRDTLRLVRPESQLEKGVIIELKDAPTLLANADYVRKQATARTTTRDGNVAGEAEIRSYRAALTSKQRTVLEAVKPAIPASSDIRNFDLVSNSVYIEGAEAEQVRAVLAADREASGLVKQVLPSAVVFANLSESVSLVSAPRLWERTSSSGDPLNGTGIKIGILDTGVDYTHPDLGGCFGPNCKVAGGYDFVENDGDPFDSISGHGTSVAAIAAGIGSYTDQSGAVQPLFGVAPGAKIYAYRVLEQAGRGSEVNVLSGIERCVDPDADGNFSDRLDVCNLSFNAKGTPNSPLSTAVDAAVAAGVVMVVSAGESDDIESFVTFGTPASARKAITVSASCKPSDTSHRCLNGLSAFSLRGPVLGFPDVIKPDVVAPGESICAALATKNDVGDTADCLDSRHIYRSGSSFAAPHVAGLAALMKQAYPSASPELVKAMITGGAQDLGLDRLLQGAGLANAYEAYNKLQGQSTAAVLTGVPMKLDFDPARGAVTETRVVSLTNTSNERRTFTASLVNGSASLSASFSPEQVDVDPGQSASITVNFSADGTSVPSGSIVQGQLSFASGSDRVSGWVYAIVGNRLTADPGSFDFDLIGADDTYWMSSRTVDLTNRSLNQDLQVSLSVEFDDGQDWEGSYKLFKTRLPSDIITVPANGTYPLRLDLEVESLKLPNGEYRGVLNITSSVQTIRIPFVVFKGWKAKLDYGSEGPRPEVVVVYNGNGEPNSTTKNHLVYPKSTDTEYTLKLTESGPWFVDAHYADAVVFKSGVSLDAGTTVIELRESEATIRIGTDALRPNGDEPTEGKAITAISQGGMRSLGRASTIQDAKAGIRVNKFTSDIVFSAAYVETYGDDFYVWQYFNRGTGATDNVILKQGEFTEKFIHAPQNINVGDTTSLSLYARPSPVGRTLVPYAFPSVKRYPEQVSSNSPIKRENGTIARLYASKNANVSLDSTDFQLQANFGLMALPSSYVPGVGYPEGHYVLNDRLFVGKDSSYAHYPWAEYNLEQLREMKRVVIIADTSDTLSLGAGPDFSNFRWTQHGSYDPKFGDLTNGHSFEGGAQRYVLLDRRMAYSFYRNDELVKKGEVEVSRSLGEGDDGFEQPLSVGDYRLVTTFKQMIAGKEMIAVADTRFTHTDAREDDQSPPALDRLAIVANELVQNVIDPSVSNVMRFSIDPVIWQANQQDTLSNVTAEYSADGVEWTALVVDEKSATDFTAALTVDPRAEIHHMRISAQDSSRNTFIYTFQMPSGTAVSRSSLPATPTPTPTWTSTPLPTATATWTPTATPTNTPAPQPMAPPRSDNPGVEKAQLAPVKATVKNRDLVIAVPPLRQSSDLMSMIKSNKMFSVGGITRRSAEDLTNPSNVLGKCVLKVKGTKTNASKSFNLSYSKGATIRFSRVKPGNHTANYSCRISMLRIDPKKTTSPAVESEVSSFSVR
jgi:subtilisin family serine protease